MILSFFVVHPLLAIENFQIVITWISGEITSKPAQKVSVRRVLQREEEEADPGQGSLLEFGADAKDPDKVEEKVKSVISCIPLSTLLTAKICTLLGTTLHTTANSKPAFGSDLKN